MAVRRSGLILPPSRNPVEAFKSYGSVPTDIPDIIEFVCSDRYLNRPNLYPRQGTLLKIIFLADDLFCVDDETEILTRRGWLGQSEVKEGDQTLSLRADGMAEWVPIERMNRFPVVDQQMVSMEGRGHSSLTTHNHRWLVERLYQNNRNPRRETEFVETKDLRGTDKIACSAPVDGLPAEAVWSDDFVELVAWYWTEGHKVVGGPGATVVQSQKANPYEVEAIRDCLTRLYGPSLSSMWDADGHGWCEDRPDDRGMVIFRLNSSISDDLVGIAPGSEKVVEPGFLVQLTLPQLELFIDVSMRADGHRPARSQYQGAITQRSKRRLDSFQIACTLAGLRSNLRYRPVGGNGRYRGRERWNLSILGTHRHFMPKAAKPGNQRTFSISEVSYTGTVWCPTTRHGTWLARRNGMVYFTGNTDYDFEVIGEWEDSYLKSADDNGEGNNGIVPGVLDRIAINKAAGRKWFREVLAVIGRRGSKGHIGGIATAYILWHYITKGDPQGYYGVDRDKRLTGIVFAGKKEQAVANQWKDINNILLGATCFSPYISRAQAEKITLFSRHDFVSLAERESRGIYTDQDMATFEIVPRESTVMAGRGPAAFLEVYDECAHVVKGVAKAPAGLVYESATPALDQFGLDAFIYLPSSPWQKIGLLYEKYQQSLERDPDGSPSYPEMLMIQQTSWAQPLDTPVLTPTGWVPMGDISVGSRVVGSDGTPTEVTGVLRPPRDRSVYRVTMTDGTSTECSGQHLWKIETNNERSGRQKRKGSVVSTLRIAEMLEAGKNFHTYIPMLSSPVEFDSIEDLPIPSYAMGALLGDGCFRAGTGWSGQPRFSADDSRPDVEKESLRLLMDSLHERFSGLKSVYYSRSEWGINDPYVPKECLVEGCSRVSKTRGLCGRCYYRIGNQGGLDEYPSRRHTNRLRVALSDLGLWGVIGHEKFIPERYLRASVNDRIALLQGLMDTDGSHDPDRNSNIFYNASPKLISGVTDLVESLGGTAYPYWREPRGPRQGPGGKIINSDRPACHLSIRLPAVVDEPPFRLTYKRESHLAHRKTSHRKAPARRIKRVEYVGEKDMQCIEVAAEDGLYLTEHGIVTHNCIYKDWERAHEIPRAPGELPYQSLRGAVQTYDHQMQQLQRANPETFAVERLSHFASVMDAYLNPAKIATIWEPWPGPDRPMKTVDRGILSTQYRAHGDPSRSGAGFGFAIGHVEGPDERGFPHVVFDVIDVWQPADYEGHEIDYEVVQNELADYLDRFMPYEMTFDQFGSVSLIQSLQRHARAKRYPKQVQIYERTATGPLNWKTAETFKTALNLGLISAPFHELANAEMTFLQESGGKVDKPSSGPVTTKDVFDAMSIVVYELIGDQMSAFVGQMLSGVPLVGGAQGGMDPYGPQREEAHQSLSAFGRGRSGAAARRRGR